MNGSRTVRKLRVTVGGVDGWYPGAVPEQTRGTGGLNVRVWPTSPPESAVDPTPLPREMPSRSSELPPHIQLFADLLGDDWDDEEWGEDDDTDEPNGPGRI